MDLSDFEKKAKDSMRKIFEAVGVPPEKGFSELEAKKYLNGLVQTGMKLGIPGIMKYNETSYHERMVWSVEDFFRRADRNHDGLVTLEEAFNAVANRLKLEDRAPGELEMCLHSLEQFCDILVAKAAKNGKERVQEVRELFKSAFDLHDKDKNGVLDLEEMRAGGMQFIGASVAKYRPDDGWTTEIEMMVSNVLEETNKTEEGKVSFEEGFAYCLKRLTQGQDPESFFDGVCPILYCLYTMTIELYLGGHLTPKNVPGALGTAAIKAADGGCDRKAGLRALLVSEVLLELCVAYGVEECKDLLLLEEDDIKNKMGCKPIQAKKLTAIIKQYREQC
eukprot:CAMPEP_0181344750 /NCGR_PEP_ID=MMETSP1101-20121128/32358_1 /TAXON_ID=46948 /ORGANISM="Rhodomonas abbreviata, Strain Caron Lab Isolate" /LENGTH=334 /DNA_ID=CAMNT_0023456611 /DNA_START=52 /DNA_END=1056 /DNA_ORIENTATION=+